VAQPLTPLYHPRSVVLVGAGTTPGKLGARIVDNLVDNGFTGRVFPVNRRGGEIRGHRVYPDLASLPEPADAAYVLVPADAAVDAARELGRAGTKVAIIAAAGFAETGTAEGRAREDALTAIAAETGMRIVGPNCNGIYSATHGVSIGFNTAHGVRHSAGGVAVLSHSGALFSTMMLRAEEIGMGLSGFVSTGNECDLTTVDHMEYFVEDPATTVLALLLDSVTDGERFGRVVAAAKARGKTVLALKLGTSEVGASAAVAHSSRMAGSAAAYAAFLAHHGVGTVDTIEQLITAARLAESDLRAPARPRLGITAMSGGAGTTTADAASRWGLAVPPLSAATRRAIDERAPGALLENPVDFGGAQGRLKIRELIDLVAGDPGVDVLVHYHHPQPGSAGVAAAEALVSGRSTHGKPVLVLAPGGVGPEEEPRYAAAGIPVVRDTDVLMGAVAALGAAAEPAPATPDPVVPQDLGPVDEVEGTRLLAAAGVPMAELAVADSADEAVAHAERIGWPVVLKGVVAGVAHKSDLGLVVVGVADAQRARAEATRLFGVGASAVTVQPVVRGALEALAGIVTEPGLGRFLVVGLGGVHAEALADLAMVQVEAGRAELREAVQRTRLGAVLCSPRWGAPGAVDALVGVLDRLAAFARAHGPALEAVDINPLLLDGEAVVGVDALVVRAAPAAEVLA